MSDEFYTIKLPEPSPWKCYLFGSDESGIVWRPNKGCHPNFLWRLMQYLLFGNKWVKSKE